MWRVFARPNSSAAFKWANNGKPSAASTKMAASKKVTQILGTFKTPVLLVGSSSIKTKTRANRDNGVFSLHSILEILLCCNLRQLSGTLKITALRTALYSTHKSENPAEAKSFSAGFQFCGPKNFQNFIRILRSSSLIVMLLTELCAADCRALMNSNLPAKFRFYGSAIK